MASDHADETRELRERILGMTDANRLMQQQLVDAQVTGHNPKFQIAGFFGGGACGHRQALVSNRGFTTLCPLHIVGPGHREALETDRGP